MDTVEEMTPLELPKLRGAVLDRTSCRRMFSRADMSATTWQKLEETVLTVFVTCMLLGAGNVLLQYVL